MFVRFDFVHFFFFFSLAAKLIRSVNGVSILEKMLIFPTPTLLNDSHKPPKAVHMRAS